VPFKKSKIQSVYNRKFFVLSGFVMASFIVLFFMHDSVSAEIRKCLKEGDSYEAAECLAPYFKKITREKSARIALEKAVALVERGDLASCHVVAHEIGEANAERYAQDPGAAFASCTRDCLGGCYHGAIRWYIESGLSGEQLATGARALCEAVVGDTLRYIDCVHGIGHGLVASEELTFDEMIGACRTFDGEKQSACLSGVFMQNTEYYLDLPPKNLREQLHLICAHTIIQADARLKEMCFFSIGEGIMFYNGFDDADARSYCDLFMAEENTACQKGVNIQERLKTKKFTEELIP